MENLVSDLNQFADYCRETSGGSFTLTKLKGGKWQISFTAKGIIFQSDDVKQVVHIAQSWLVEKRKIIEVETKWTLY